MTLTSPAPPAPDAEPAPLPTRPVRTRTASPSEATPSGAGVRPELDRAPLPTRPVRPRPPSEPPPAVAPSPGRLRGFWYRRAGWLGLLAILVGGVGQALLTVEAWRIAGVAVLLAGMVLGGVAWSAWREAPLLGSAPAAALVWRPALVLRLAGIAGSAILAAEAVAAYRADPNAIFGLQGWLWGGSMALLLGACARWYPRTSRESDLGPAWTRAEAAVFLGLIALTGLTHLLLLDAIPWRFHFDEGFAYRETMRYYREPTLSVFTTTWLNTSLPSFWFVLAAGMMHLTGIGLAGVRLSVALAGALLVVPVYGIARLAWGRLAAAIAGFAVAVSAAAIHYSRVSILNITTATAWAICFYFLLRGLRSRRPGDWVWAGLAAGLSMYTYYGTRLLPYLLAVFVAYLCIFHFQAARTRLGHFALLALGFLAGFGPLLGYFLDHPDMWASRASQELIIPSGIPTSWPALVADWNILAPLAWQDFLGFSVQPGRDTVWYAPLLLPGEALLLFLGAAVLVWRWRQPAAFLLLLSGLGVLLSGGLLLDATTIPNFAHWTPVFGVFYLALALPLALVAGALRRQGRALGLAGLVLVAAILGGDAIANAHLYLVSYPPTVPPDHSLEALQGRFIEQQPPGTRVEIVGKTWQLLNPLNAAMMGPDKPAADLLNPSRELPLVGDPTRDLAFALYSDQEAALPMLQALYPHGQVSTLQTPDGNHLGTGYTVPAALAWDQYGVLVDVHGSPTSGAGGGRPGAPTPPLPEAHAHVPLVGALPPQWSPAAPALATWSGALYLQPALLTHLRVDGPAGARIWVDGAVVTPDTSLTPAGGWVRFQVQARLPATAAVHLVVQQGDGPFQEPDQAHLWPVPPGQGLAVTLGSGGPAVHRIDPFVSTRYLSTAGGNDPAGLGLVLAPGALNQVRWEGEVLTGAGPYEMSLRTNALAQLRVDDTLVVNQCTPVPPLNPDPHVEGAITLTAGWHRVRLDLQVAPGYQGVEWRWTRPDGVTETVPPAALRWTADPAPFPAVPWPAVPPPIICP